MLHDDDLNVFKDVAVVAFRHARMLGVDLREIRTKAKPTAKGSPAYVSQGRDIVVAVRFTAPPAAPLWMQWHPLPRLPSEILGDVAYCLAVMKARTVSGNADAWFPKILSEMSREGILVDGRGRRSWRRGDVIWVELRKSKEDVVGEERVKRERFLGTLQE